MNKISAIILTKNSEDSLLETLRSITFCDEIIIIDSNSTDATIQIAKKVTQKIYKENSLDFAKKRTLGLTKASHNWVLYVDADEVISNTLKSAILQTVEDAEFDAFSFIRKNFYLGKNEWPFQETVTRLFKKEKLEKWVGSLHESPLVNGKIGKLDGYLLHFTHKNLSSMLEKTNQWSDIESQLRFATNHPQMTTWRFFRIFLTGFSTYYIKQGGWKVGTVGLIESIYQGFSLFITYAKLWERQMNEKLL